LNFLQVLTRDLKNISCLKKGIYIYIYTLK